MTFRRSTLFTTLPILALVPFLAAPRGCHFGAADVPLGANHDEAGGAGNGDGGDGANPPVGGSGGANTGGSGASSGGGSGASTGGDAGSLGGSGGSSGGSGGAGGSSSSDLPCIETMTKLSDFEENPAPFDRWQVEEWFEGAHRAPFAPRHFDPTMTTLQFVGPIELFWVESHQNPDLPDILYECENHVRARTYARFFSDDGLFDETLPALEFRIEPLGDGSANLVSENLMAGDGVTLLVNELRGTYKDRFSSVPMRDGACLWGIQFDFGISKDRFSGAIFDLFIPNPLLGASCLENDPDELEGSTVVDWFCQGDCRDVPNVSIVVEADSCDRFGEQLTEGGDEASFSRDGDVLTRDEVWGCGCPSRPEFVMAYSRTSPMELRLCHEDGADTCEALCQAPVSHDLTGAFRWAGPEFRFVD